MQLPSRLVWMKSLGFPHNKYLGCVIDEYLVCSGMVEHRVKLSSQTLGTWLRRCRESVGEMNGRSFLQLLQSLVESV